MAMLSRATSWLLTPAVEEGPRSHAVAAVALRLVAGFLWLYNVSWKYPPDFGEDHGSGLYRYTHYAVTYPVFAPYSWVVEHLVLPNFQFFGWAVLVVETTLAVMLLTGAFVRVAAALGVAQAVAIGLSAAYAPGEWPWSYVMMIAIHLLLLFSAAGRFLSVDAVRARISDGHRLAATWGWVGLGTGLLAVVLSVADLLAAKGPVLGLPGLEVGVGSYNALGGGVLLILGGLLVSWVRSGVPTVAIAAAVVAALAGVSLTVQVGFSDPVLGGSGTSAAFYFAFATVAAALALSARRRTPSSRSPIAVSASAPR